MFYNNSIFRSKIGPKPFMQYRETVIEISLTFYMKFLYQDFHIKCKKDVNNLHILCQEYTFSALAVLVGWEESIQPVKKHLALELPKGFLLWDPSLTIGDYEHLGQLDKSQECVCGMSKTVCMYGCPSFYSPKQFA